MEKTVKVMCTDCSKEVTYPEHGRTQYVICPDCGKVVDIRKPEPLSPVFPAYVYSGQRRLTEVSKQERNLELIYTAELIVLGAGSNIRKKMDRKGKTFAQIMEDACAVSWEYLQSEK